MKPFQIALIALFVALILSPPVGTADQLRQMYVLIEDLDAEDAQCGVAVDALRSRAVLVLRQNGIAVGSDSSHWYVYVNANVMPLERQVCVTSLSVQILGATQSVVFRSNEFRAPPISTFSVPVCEKGSIMIAPKHELGDMVYSAVESQLKTCLGKLEY